jgi:hypothetical protein
LAVSQERGIESQGYWNWKSDWLLLVVRGSIPERVVDPAAVPFRSIHKSVEILFDIDRFQDQASVPNCVSVFDQNSRGAVDAPHPESRIKKSTARIQVFQPFHGVETIDRLLILSGKAVIGLVADSAIHWLISD